jgi:hypothetical protein
MTFFTASWRSGWARAWSGSRISSGSGPSEAWASTIACACGSSRPEAGERLFEVAVPRIGPPEDDEQLLDLLALVLGVVVLVGHPDLRPDRVEHRLLRERVDGQLEGDLVDQDTAVAAAGLQVLELPVDDRVVVGDQVVDVAGLGRVLQGHGSLPGIDGTAPGLGAFRRTAR